jgi:16S rRNA C967 or C1407 C5-methylase (RsmB/RsmF family)/NOL1/NOP2/fmu family ribosome biogenesis protein
VSDGDAARIDALAEVVENGQDLAAALDRPTPVCIAVQPQRIQRDALLEILGRDAAEALPWDATGIRLPPGAKPGRHWTHRAGLFTVQEEASLMPVALLDVRPGHRVLDLCAAPGIKTTRLALAMGNRGTLVANDVSGPRLGTIQDISGRLGVLNLSVCRHDGARLPDCGAFDRILVDAPCSAEGNPGKHGSRAALGGGRAGFRDWVTRQQRGLLGRALQLCAVGGRVVYSTCTLAPEENECIVADVLEAFGDRVRALPVQLPGLATRPGLTTWAGRRLPQALSHAVRLWPHVAGTGSFFGILLEKTAGPAPPPARALPVPASCDALDRLLERHGIDRQMLAEPLVAHRRSKYFRVVTADHAPPAGLAYAAHGMPLMHVRARVPRCTTQGALVLGQLATRHVVELPEAQRDAYHGRARLRVPLDPVTRARCPTIGPVIVRCAGHTLGVAQLRDLETGGATLDSEYPRAWAAPSGSS